MGSKYRAPMTKRRTKGDPHLEPLSSGAGTNEASARCLWVLLGCRARQRGASAASTRCIELVCLVWDLVAGRGPVGIV